MARFSPFNRRQAMPALFVALLVMALCNLIGCTGSSPLPSEVTHDTLFKTEPHNGCIPGYFDKSQAELDAVRGTPEYYRQQRCPI